MYFTLSARIFFIASALFILHAVARSQTNAPAPTPHASSISGRVTIGANPAVNKRVVVRQIKMDVGSSGPFLQGDESRSGKVHIAVTDADGKYRVTGLPAGAYIVSMDILRSYAQASQSGRKSKQIQLEEEEERSNVDFELARGGVITGRVTDPDGRPIIAGYVNINQVDETISDFTAGGRSFQTDDRGIYRIYGLPAGRYRVSASAPGKSWQKYAVSYHPGATDRKQAAVIEVKEGSEAGDIDIRLSVKKKEGYDITGRVIASETGKPISQGTIYCHGLGPARDQFRYESVDTQGGFRLTDLAPGQYALRVGPGYSSPAQEKFYSDQTIIEVTQGDVSGVEVIAKRGGAISGTIVFEDDRSTALKDRISQTVIICKISSKGSHSVTSSSGAPTRVKSDGSFLLEGLPPQIASLGVGDSSGARPPLLLRVERDGAAISNSIEISPGQTIAGIRLVLTNITGTIRGQVNFTGEGLPEGQRLTAFVYRNNDDSSYPTVFVDKKGRFVIEGLADGEYQVVLNMRAEDGSSGSFAGSQRVQVARGSETQATFMLDLNEGRRKNSR